jgi:hypothetical protein
VLLLLLLLLLLLFLPPSDRCLFGKPLHPFHPLFTHLDHW